MSILQYGRNTENGIRTHGKKRTLILVFLVVFVIVVVFIAGFKLYDNYQEKQMRETVSKYAKDGVLIYGADDSAPPLRFIDSADGQYKGVSVDYINLIALELGVRIVSKPYKWDKAIAAVKNGSTDMCDMFANSERAKSLVFTDPLYTLRTIVVTRSGKHYGLSDLNSLVIATQSGDYANWYLKKHYAGAKLVYVHDVGAGLDKLLNDEVDAVIGDEPVLQYYADKKGIKDKISTINTALYEEPVVLGVSKDKADLIKPLNAAIKKARATGQVDKIQQRWYGISTPMIEDSGSKTDLLKYFLIAFLIAICAVVLKMINNKALKNQVVLRTSQLEKSKDELDTMLNTMPEGVLVYGEDSRIVASNGPAAELINTEVGQVSGCSVREFFNKMESIAKTDSIDYSYLTGDNVDGKIEIGKKKFEVKNYKVDSMNTPEARYMMTIKDITAEEINNNQLLQSSKMIAIGQLAGGMAHQLRNPLGVIRTQSYILHKQKDTTEATKRSLHYIDNSVDRASNIIDNVMNFWRMSDTTISKINVADTIAMIVSLNSGQIKKKDINIETMCDDPMIINSNKESLKHILMNVLQNAIEAINHDKGNIVIKVTRVEDNVVIECADNGSGIDKNNIDELYNPFFTTKPPGEGTGLGLYVTYNEVKQLGGRIEVKSNMGVGTKFTITIPGNYINEKDE